MLALFRQLAQAIERRLGGGPEPTVDPRNGAVVHELLDPAFLSQELRKVQEGGHGLLSGQEYDHMYMQLSHADESPVSGADASQGRQAFLPRSPAVSMLQSTLTDCVLSRVEDLVKPLPTGQRSFAEFMLRESDVFRKFGPCDAAWIESAISKGIALFDSPPDFVDGYAPEVALADNARLVVVGDWGTGLPGARAVAKQMARAITEGQSQGREVHAIHLGDVYYSGWKEEYRSRFMPYWPVRSAAEGVPSWALNGNHDMYSGGHGYFGYLLRDPRFAGHKGSSYFCLRTSSWQLLGLDTAYVDSDLAGKQAEWVARKLDEGNRRTMLLSHHQPFSSYVAVNPPLVRALADAGVKHVEAWLWGHEHLCCTYEHGHNPLVGFGSCIGHGGVPVLAREEGPPPGVSWEFDKAEAHEGDDRWQLFGYAVLDFDGPTIDICYYDQDGIRSHAETIV